MVHRSGLWKISRKRKKRSHTFGNEEPRYCPESLVADRPIKKGELFSPENLTFKRPGKGLSPMAYWKLLGKRSGRDYDKDEMILDTARRGE